MPGATSGGPSPKNLANLASLFPADVLVLSGATSRPLRSVIRRRDAAALCKSRRATDDPRTLIWLPPLCLVSLRQRASCQVVWSGLAVSFFLFPLARCTRVAVGEMGESHKRPWVMGDAGDARNWRPKHQSRRA